MLKGTLKKTNEKKAKYYKFFKFFIFIFVRRYETKYTF